MHLDRQQGRTVAELLYSAFRSGGLPGKSAMPLDLVPEGVARGSREHLLFVTLTAAVDYEGNAVELWKSSRLAYENPATRYLFEPAELSKAPFDRIIRDLQRCTLSRKPIKDAQVWATITTTFLKKYDNDPRNMLASCNYKADLILQELHEGRHGRGRRIKPDFPCLGRPEMGPLWIGMLRNNLGYRLENIETIPIPVDIQIAGATLALGVIGGRYEGPFLQLFDFIRKAWFESMESAVRPDGLPLIALDIAEPLRQISRRGCGTGHGPAGEACAERQSCPCRDHCIPLPIELNRSKDIVKFNTGESR